VRPSFMRAGAVRTTALLIRFWAIDNTNMIGKLRAAMHSTNYKTSGIARYLRVATRLGASGFSLIAH
jgi:hypothetical protein